MKKFIVYFMVLALGGCNNSSKGSGQKTTENKIVNTSGDQKKTPEVENKKQTEVKKSIIIEPEIWNTVAEVEKACSSHLGIAQTHQKVLEGNTLDGKVKALDVMNELLIEMDRILPAAELIANAHENKKVREAAEKCEQKAKKFASNLKLNQAVYKTLKSTPENSLDPLSKRFRSRILLDYKRSGVDRDEKTRSQLALIEGKIVKLSQEYGKNLRGDKKTVSVKKSELKGLPEDFIKSRKTDKKGNLIISTDYPDFFPVQKYAISEKLRKNLYTKFLSRGYPANEKVLQEILTLRNQYATILGYSSWSQYMAEDKMVKTSKAVKDFIDKVADISRKRMKEDLKALLTRKKKDNRRARNVGVYDRFYYVQKIQSEKYGVNPQEVRAHFNFNSVKQGVLDTAQKMYGVKFLKVENAKVWHKSVEAYNIMENGRIIARFYLDMHSRDGKYGHAAEFPIYSGVSGIQLPSAALVTNFPDPSKHADGVALMEHGQVTTFFHEFGHLMHQLFSGNHKWINQSGINCEWDFVEAPSQMMEEWAWDTDVLSKFAFHNKTKKPISKELVEKMKKANEFGKGVHIMRQMFYAALSHTYHDRIPGKPDLMKILRNVQKKYSPWDYLPKTATYANFGHLVGYSSQYYTYMWSLVIAKDLFTKFTKDGLMNTDTAKLYRDKVLAKGGSRDAADMVSDFLGRPYNFEAFKKYLLK
ncbi:MAG: Zn-dependent oligopeptidase [Deltaproteobacteria bacterium]|nr:Zn-dependent oligopeptidase [Deltaproteobacteria bacterium]